MGRKKNLAQRVTIIKTAYQLFVEEGYDKVTTKQVAEACNMAHSLLHYYYPTKSDLLTDIINTMIAKLHSYIAAEGVDLTDKLYVYGLFNRLFFEVLTVNRKLLGIYQAALTDGEVLRRWTKYAVDKIGLVTADSPEKAKIAPYMLSGAMGQILPLYVDTEIHMELRETVNLGLDVFYAVNGLTKAWIHATVGLIDRRMTTPFIRGFLNDFTEMMGG
ncbi:MAG: TetR/AcrR family transcriptional regulator [Oscillospiraceae bacterium]|nr:TetR/AcrR family transcriptional regulator [Oscillospiraceae bacterium]